MKLGEAIAQVRNQVGLTQDELADACGISKPSISRIEAEKQWPSRESLERIAQELDVCVYQLFAIAEGVTLPMANETAETIELRHAMQVMEPEARYLISRLADLLPKKAE